MRNLGEYSYSGPFVTVEDVEYLAVKCDICSVVQISPVPVITNIVLWESLSLDQLA